MLAVPEEEGASMVSSDATGNSAARTAAQFTTTHWSVVFAAGHGGSTSAAEALNELCRTYWYPLYAYARRTGSSPEDAEDLTQGFFERIREKHHGKNFAPNKGRFRTYLLIVLQHFPCDQFDRPNAAKRGVAPRLSPRTPSRPRPCSATRPPRAQARKQFSSEPGPTPWSTATWPGFVSDTRPKAATGDNRERGDTNLGSVIGRQFFLRTG